MKEILFSFDVVSSFTNVPTNLAAEIAKQWLSERDDFQGRTDWSVREFCEGLDFCMQALLGSEIPSGKCAKLHTVAASNNRVHPTRSLYYCSFAPHRYIFVLHAHPVRGESHNQRNNTGEVATASYFIFRGKYFRRMFRTSMDSPVPPILANSVIEDIENKTMREFLHLFEDHRISNDIPNDFKIVKYFRFCRLQTKYSIDHPHIL